MRSLLPYATCSRHCCRTIRHAYYAHYFFFAFFATLMMSCYAIDVSLCCHYRHFDVTLLRFLRCCLIIATSA